MEKIDLQDHLAKLVTEWRQDRLKNPRNPSLRQTLEILQGSAYLNVKSTYSPEEVARLIVQDLSNMGQDEKMEDYLNRSEDARMYNLYDLLSEFHPSELS